MMSMKRKSTRKKPPIATPVGHWCVAVEPWTHRAGQFTVRCRASDASGKRVQGRRFEVVLAITGSALPKLSEGDILLWFPDDSGRRVAMPRNVGAPSVLPQGPIRPIASHGAITKRNLLYHVAPFADNDGWRKNVRQIAQRMDLFNGRRLVGVATGPEFAPLSAVREAFLAADVEFFRLPNAPLASDCTTFRTLLPMLHSHDPHEATFFAHTKGASATMASCLGVTFWRNALYHHLLDDFPSVEHALQTHACAGGCKMNGGGFPSGLSRGTWHFSGTFFWFRHDCLFGHSQWMEIPFDRYGAEAYLGGLFAPEEAISLYQPPLPTPIPEGVYYRQETHTTRISDDPPLPRPTIHIGTAITLDYLSCAMPYLESLHRASRDNKFCVCFGFYIPDDLRNRFSSIRFVHLPRGCIDSYNMIQHGPWMDACPWIRDEDLCIFTDADVRVQRAVTEEEANRYARYDATTIGLGTNASERDTLQDEAERIGLVDPHGVYPGDWSRIPVYNCGVIVARARLFRDLRAHYDAEAPRYHNMVFHRARCQWLIAYLVHKHGWKVDRLGTEIHVNGHFGVPAGCSYDEDGRLVYRDRFVMFRHRI